MRPIGAACVVALEIAYGLISRFLAPDGADNPTSCAASDACWMPPCPRARGTGVRNDSSFFQRLVRNALKPHVWLSPWRYRSDLNGMAASTVHPPSNRPVANSQIAF